MPFVAPVTHANGTVMSWSDIASNASAFRAWYNDIPVGDLVAGGIRREHLVKPSLDLFGFRSPHQQLHPISFGLGEADALTPDEWGSRVERLTIIPFVNESVGNVWKLPIGATIYCPVSRQVEVHLSLEWQVRNDENNPTYPDGAGGPANAAIGGYFILHSFVRSTGVDTPFEPGRQAVYPIEGAAAGALPYHNDHGHVSLIETFGAGAEVDIYLAYHRETAPTALERIDVSRVQGVIEGL